ncbi:DUF3099 domain-containing protein [Amycolatopsis jiangsuensis]|uniref:DUF3099 domain-containing protein n=1 Tax=Amycolatopsis jiangsuensis TaxID=1181879 RepID=UPI001611634D|nr:DUF3099 domain-containing protein [Amycolatopsis jiangsuensis]
MGTGGGAVNAPAEGPEPRPAVLITEAEPSYEEQLATRKRKYVTMMVCRIPCLILAGLTYHTWWLALTFLVISIPLPWVAVLVANDRPPRKSENVNRYAREAGQIEQRDHRVIDG